MSTLVNITSINNKSALKIRERTRINIPVNPDYNRGKKDLEINILDYERGNDTEIAIPIRIARDCGYIDEGERHDALPIGLLEDGIKLRNYQKEDLTEILKKLALKRTCMLNLYTGYGKTVLSIYLAQLFHKTTMVLTYSSRIREQWVDRIAKFLPDARCIVLESLAQEIPDSFCFVLVGIDKLRMEIDKYSNKVYSRERLSTFEFIIIDEVHDRLCGEKSHNILNYLTPEYMIGCSATPTKAAKVPLLLEPYFGPPGDYIRRSNINSFRVIRINTNITPVYSRTYAGKLKWTNVLKSLAYNEERQLMLFEHGIKKPYEDGKKIIVLSKFKLCLDKLAVLCAMNDISHCCAYGGNRKRIDTSVSVILGIMSGIGTGFDDTTRQVVTLCDDYTDVAQYTGRIRNKDKTVIEFRDHTNLFNKHIRQRDSFYALRGITIEREY